MPVLIEIFHDQASGRLPTEAVHEGLALVAEYSGSILVTRETRQIKLTDPTSDHVDSDKIRWPQLPANFSIILTDRPLVSSFEEGAASQANSVTTSLKSNRDRIAGTALIGVDVALISLHNAHPHNVPTTVAHELGHLFEILLEDTASGHCLRDECIMNAVVTKQTTKTIDTSTLSKRLKQRAGRPEFSYLETPSAVKFCGDCAEELAERGPIIAARMAIKTMRNFDKL